MIDVYVYLDTKDFGIDNPALKLSVCESEKKHSVDCLNLKFKHNP